MQMGKPRNFSVFSFVSSVHNYLPEFEKCPAPNSHLNSSILSSVFKSLSFATNLAGSEYMTRGSVKEMSWN